MTDGKPQTFVLVPGAWLGGWSWQPVARLLTGRGYPALALTLPGLSYDGSPAASGCAQNSTVRRCVKMGAV